MFETAGCDAVGQVLESKMMEIEHDISALHAHEKMSRNAVADGEAVLHAEAVEQAEEEAAHEATEADEALLNKQLEIEYADQTEITNIEAEINADKSFIETLKKHISASTSLSDAEKAQLEAELKAEEADLARLEAQLKDEQAKLEKDAEEGAKLREKYAGDQLSWCPAKVLIRWQVTWRGSTTMRWRSPWTSTRCTTSSTLLLLPLPRPRMPRLSRSRARASPPRCKAGPPSRG